MRRQPIPVNKAREPAARRFGVAAAEMRRDDLPAAAVAAARAGAEGIGVSSAELRRLGTSRAVQILADVGITASSVSAIGKVVERGATGTIDDELAVLDAAAGLGAPTVLALTGPLAGLTARAADERCRAWLERLAPRAAERALVIAVEPMFPLFAKYTYVHTLPHALELVRGLDGAGVVIDTGHLWWEPRLVELVRTHIAAVGTVQITNVSVRALDGLRYERAPLGEGEIPLRDLVEAFDAAGYRGWYEHEVLTSQPDDRVEFVRQARRWFDQIWESDG